MATAKSVEAGFHTSRIDFSRDEDRHSLQNPQGIPYPGRGESPEYAVSNSLPRLNCPLPSMILPAVDFRSYCLPAGTLSDDKTTRTTTDPGLTSNAVALYNLLKEQVVLPPRPIVQIKGAHLDHVYSHSHRLRPHPRRDAVDHAYIDDSAQLR
jgi:hypothetical protein